jgi:hypothetical protein
MWERVRLGAAVVAAAVMACEREGAATPATPAAGTKPMAAIPAGTGILDLHGTRRTLPNPLEADEARPTA